MLKCLNLSAAQISALATVGPVTQSLTIARFARLKGAISVINNFIKLNPEARITDHKSAHHLKLALLSQDSRDTRQGASCFDIDFDQLRNIEYLATLGQQPCARAFYVGNEERGVLVEITEHTKPPAQEDSVERKKFVINQLKCDGDAIVHYLMQGHLNLVADKCSTFTKWAKEVDTDTAKKLLDHRWLNSKTVYAIAAHVEKITQLRQVIIQGLDGELSATQNALAFFLRDLRENHFGIKKGESMNTTALDRSAELHAEQLSFDLEHGHLKSAQVICSCLVNLVEMGASEARVIEQLNIRGLVFDHVKLIVQGRKDIVALELSLGGLKAPVDTISAKSALDNARKELKNTIDEQTKAVDNLLARMQKMATDFKKKSNTMSASMDMPVEEIGTGFEAIFGSLEGGFREGELVVIGTMRAGTGKTFFGKLHSPVEPVFTNKGTAALLAAESSVQLLKEAVKAAQEKLVQEQERVSDLDKALKANDRVKDSIERQIVGLPETFTKAIVRGVDGLIHAYGLNMSATMLDVMDRLSGKIRSESDEELVSIVMAIQDEEDLNTAGFQFAAKYFMGIQSETLAVLFSMKDSYNMLGSSIEQLAAIHCTADAPNATIDMYALENARNDIMKAMATLIRAGYKARSRALYLLGREVLIRDIAGKRAEGDAQTILDSYPTASGNVKKDMLEVDAARHAAWISCSTLYGAKAA